MDTSGDSVNEHVSRLAKFLPEQILRATRSELHAPLTMAKGYCQILMNNNAPTPDKQKEYLSHILFALENIEEIMATADKALTLRELTKNSNSEG